MVAYEFYLRDEKGKELLIGALPERRRKPERITHDSILNRGRKLIGHHSHTRNIYFVPVEMQELNL